LPLLKFQPSYICAWHLVLWF